jgi:hypothetical protein
VRGVVRNQPSGQRFFQRVHALKSLPQFFDGLDVFRFRVGDWKLSYLTRPGKTALINLRDDIGEENNLVKENLDKAAELKTIFARITR